MIERNRNATVTVGVTSTKLSEAVYNPALRKVLVIVNTSTGGQNITVAFGTEAVAGQGIFLYPAGSWSETLDNAYIPTQSEINAISSAVGGTVAIQERIVS
jgi:hypothetical protein